MGLARLAAAEGEVVLEIGPGPGEALVAIRRAVGAGGAAIGLDVSGGMLRQAGARLRRAGYAPGHSLVRGSSTDLPLPEASIDAVVATFTLDLLGASDLRLALGECLRVLRPGGRICVVALDRREPAPPVARMYEWFHRTVPDWVDCAPFGVQQELEAAGFRTASVRRLAMFGLPVAVVLATKPDGVEDRAEGAEPDQGTSDPA
jgi:ubiquinone/menaquinone biosynthesis C-methylase UbiE